MQGQRKMIDGLGAAALLVGALVSLVLVPRHEWSQVASPTTRGMYGFFLALAAIALARALGRPRLERAFLALLLAGMPVIYVEAGLASDAVVGMPIWPEFLGLIFFAGVAVAGYFRPPLLAAGIVAHGVLWDLWHLGSGPVPDWYAVACAIVDVSLGAYAASRLRAWRLGAFG